jgi:phosphoglycolate phosphatase-like HAD superfamily hydrolase
MKRYDTLLFDLDGTLINSVKLILDSYHHTLLVHGIPARSDDDWLRGVGTPLRVQFADWDDGSGKIEELVCVDDVVNPKPHPEPVEKAVRLLGTAADRAIFFGDSVHDMHSGRAAGVTTAAVLWGPFGRAHLESSSPDYWLTTPGEILPLVRA